MANRLQQFIIALLTAAALLLAGCGNSTVQSSENTSAAVGESSINKENEAKAFSASEVPPLPDEAAESPAKSDYEGKTTASAEAPAENEAAESSIAEESIEEDEQPENIREQASATPLLACNYYDEMLFEAHLQGREAAAEILDMQEGLRAAIIPHHLTAGDYIAAVFEQAAQEEFDTVVFLAPNHTGQGGNIVYSASDWDTPFGILPCDKELTEFIMRDKQIKGSSNDSRMQDDHAISGLIPYLAYFMPEVQTMSVLLSGSVDFAKVRYMAELLAQSEKEILLICSVDFSHYLQFNEAAEKDRETIAAIESANFPAIAHFNNDNFDSAPCVTAFLAYAQKLGLTQKLHWNGSSSELAGYGSEKYIEGGITTYQIWMLNEE